MSTTVNIQNRLNEIADIGGGDPSNLNFAHLNQRDLTSLLNELRATSRTAKALFDTKIVRSDQVNSSIEREKSSYNGSALVGRVSTLERGHQEQMTMLEGRASELNEEIDELVTIGERIQIVEKAVNETIEKRVETPAVAEERGCGLKAILGGIFGIASIAGAIFAATYPNF